MTLRPLGPLRWLGLALLLWSWSGQALAERTLAVLPLDEAAGSEEYAGLGRAISGMLVSDLSKAEGLQLVERQRLDALLAEIDLSGSGFIDPKTAVTLGKGVSAELVLAGQWSVLGDAFLLDAAVVEVETGKLLAAADAQGTVADFVSVEKELVEELLEGVAVELSGSARRQVLGSAPTEDFEAFKVYGSGLDLAWKGRVDEARAAFESALERDPAFQEARDAMAGLAERLETEQARIQEERADATTQKWLGVLEAIPDERERPPRFRHDLESRAQFAVRSVALHALGRHCQRAEELWAFLDRAGWQLSGVKGQHAAVLKEAHTMGLIDKPPSWDTIPFDGPGFSSMGSALWSTTRLVTGLSTDVAPGRGYELLSSELACQDDAGRPVRMVAVAQALSAHGVDDLVPDPNTYPLVTLGDHLLVQEAIWTARNGGLDSELRAEVEGLVDRLKGQGANEFWAMNAAKRVLMAAEASERRRRARLGLDEDELVAIGRALVSGESGPVDRERPLCRKAADLARPMALGRIEAYDAASDPKQEQRRQMAVDGLGFAASYLLDPGCVVGEEGRAEDALGVLAWVRTADERVLPGKAEDPTCRPALEALRQRAGASALEFAQTQELADQTAVLALSWYYSSLVLTGCVDPGR